MFSALQSERFFHGIDFLTIEEYVSAAYVLDNILFFFQMLLVYRRVQVV